MTAITRLSCYIFLFALAISLAGCGSGAPVLQGGLVIEEHALQGPPQNEPLTFFPLEGSQEEILQKHATQRSEYFSNNSNSTVTLNEHTLTTKEVGDTEQGYIVVESDGAEIYRINVGMGSPISPLQGLWVYDGHWVLETARVSNTETVENGLTSVHSFALGQIVVDGVLLNKSLAYEEVFGFQTIDGKPFYFYRSNEEIGISYDGQEMMLGYEEIPHYGCCSAAEVNPRAAQNMVAFFARKGDVWYYVEIGVFD